MKFIVDWSAGRRLPREKRDRRDPGLSVAREAARRSPAGKRTLSARSTEINVSTAMKSSP